MTLGPATLFGDHVGLHHAIALPPPTRDPFQNWESNPYHLVAGPYLSAAGLVLGTVLQVRSHLLWTHG